MPDPRLVAQFRRIARLTSVITILVGALVFCGWALGSPWLDRLLVGRFIMQLNSGAAFLCAGLSLWLSTQRPRLAAALGLVVVTTGAVVLVRDALDVPGRGRMDPESAANFVLFGLALALRTLSSRSALRIGQACTVLGLLGALIAAFTHAYSVKSTFGIQAYTQMTSGTLLAFLVLGCGILFADPERGLVRRLSSDSPAGEMARRLVPAAVAVPLLLGLLTLLGEQLRVWNGKLGLTLFALTCIVAFVILISLTYGSIDRADEQRMRLAAILLEEAERRHIARELHDEIGQSLTALKFHLEMIGRGAPQEGAASVREARGLVEELMQRVSNLSLDLRPAMLDDLGLLPALVWLHERYTAQTRIEVQFQHSGLDGLRLPRELETAAFRVVQEALTNAARHSGAGSVTVRAWLRAGTLGVQVADAGRGFPVESTLARAASSGLIGMRERAAALGGTLSIDAEPGQGVTITAELPVEENHHVTS